MIPNGFANDVDNILCATFHTEIYRLILYFSRLLVQKCCSEAYFQISEKIYAHFHFNVSIMWSKCSFQVVILQLNPLKTNANDNWITYAD